MMLIIDRHTSQLYARNFLRTQQAEERCKVHAYAQSWLCCMSRLQAEERRELRHRPVALRASGVVIGLSGLNKAARTNDSELKNVAEFIRRGSLGLTTAS